MYKHTVGGDETRIEKAQPIDLLPPKFTDEIKNL